LTKPAKGINFNTKQTDNNEGEPKENPTMKHTSTAALSLLALAAFQSCKEAVIPLMSRDVDGIALAPSYTYPNSQTALSPYITKYSNFPVNPEGVGIRSVTQRSDGVTNIVLSGKVSGTRDGMSANGIPEGLHGITSLVTDYPTMPTLSDPTPADYPRYRYPDDHLLKGEPLDILLERQISLFSVSENAKYTAITLNGMVLTRPGVLINESNESIRLFAQYRPFFNRATKLNVFPAERVTYFTKDPNWFLVDGLTEQDGVGNDGYSRGGFGVLIWDGASPKTAAFEILYDGDRTQRRFLVDWNAVTFEDVPLQYMAWYTTPPAPAPAPDSKGDIVTVERVGPTPTTVIVENFTVLVKNVGTMLAGTSIDNFVTPSFYPSNATNKRVAIPECNLGDFTVEIADRIKITRIGTATGSTGDGSFTATCDTYPPPQPTDGPLAKPITLTVTLQL
jgi:hypothetical protein